MTFNPGYPKGSQRLANGDWIPPVSCEECGAMMPLAEEPERWIFTCPAGHMTRICQDGEWRNEYHDMTD